MNCEQCNLVIDGISENRDGIVISIDYVVNNFENKHADGQYYCSKYCYDLARFISNGGIDTQDDYWDGSWWYGIEGEL